MCSFAWQLIPSVVPELTRSKPNKASARHTSAQLTASVFKTNLPPIHMTDITVMQKLPITGDDSRPRVVPHSIKWLSTITRERQIPPDFESGGIPHLFGTFLSPHIGSAWRARHDNNNNNNKVTVLSVASFRGITRLSWHRRPLQTMYLHKPNCH